MTWLIYVDNGRAPSPQFIFTGDGKPFLDEGIRNRVAPGITRVLAPDESSLPLCELERRYPLPMIERGLE